MLKGKQKWDILSLFSSEGGKERATMSQRFKMHLERAKRKFVLLSVFVWSYIIIS